MTDFSPAQLGALTRRARATLKDRGLKRLPQDLRSEFQELGVKFCPGCRKVLPFDKYGKNSSIKSGIQTKCKDCHLGYHRSNRDAEVARMKDYREKNNLRFRLAAGYRRAVERGLPAEAFDELQLREALLTRGLDPDRSAYSGVPLTRENYSLDHLVPLEDPNCPGHVVSNIVPCTLSENFRKQQRHFVHLLADIHSA